MNYNSESKPSLQDQAYVAPAADLYSLEVEDTLAISNTETIDEDEDEYDWGIN